MAKDLMTNEKYTYDSLSKKYYDFKVPTYKINIDGSELTEEKSTIITELKVELTCDNEASGCQFMVMGVYNPSKRAFDKSLVTKYFQLGKKVTVSLGYIKTEMVFMGYISAVTTSIGAEMAMISVECTDAKGLMMNNQVIEQRTETKYKDVISSILSSNSYGSYSAGTQVDDIETPQKKIEIYGESDFDFLVRLANRVNYEFFVCQGKIFFRKPMPLKSPVLELEWGMNLLGFEKRCSLEGQVLELEVRSTDIDKGAVISGIAKSDEQFSNGPSGKKALKKIKKVIVDSSIISEQEATKRAEELLKRLNERYTQVQIKCVGIPEIVPGRFIKVKKLGEGLEGNYYIIRVVHSVSSEEYSTTIEARMA